MSLIAWQTEKENDRLMQAISGIGNIIPHRDGTLRLTIAAADEAFAEGMEAILKDQRGKPLTSFPGWTIKIEDRADRNNAGCKLRTAYAVAPQEANLPPYKNSLAIAEARFCLEMGSQATDALFAESIGVLVSGKPGTEADSKPASPATLFSGFTYKIEDVDGKAGYEKTIKLVYEGPDKPLHPLSKVVSLTRVNFYKPISLQTFTAER